MKQLKYSPIRFVTRVLAGITALSGWLNWIIWLNQRRKNWPKERMNTKKLHTLLYKCPVCGSESQMDSQKKKLKCLHCGSEWEMNRRGRLRKKGDQAETLHILDWIAWEKECVREEIQKGSYLFEDTVRVEVSAKGKRFGQQGIAHFKQDIHGCSLYCSLEQGDYAMIRPAKTMEKFLISYNHLGKGDCFEFPSPGGTLRCYPSKRDVVTKLAYAAEEIHRYAKTLEKER